MKRLSLFFFLANLVLVMQATTNLDNELFDAIYSESPNRVENLLDEGANPNAQQNGKTAIMVALENIKGRLSTNVLQHLLDAASKKKGALDFIADNGMTALTFAAELGQGDLVNMIIQYGAKGKVKNRFGKTVEYYLNLNRAARENEKFERELKEFEIIERPEEEPWTIIGD